jgi:simple sugar transport system permease protein
LGIQITASGEHPVAAQTAGINVTRLRYAAGIIAGALGGLGGAFLTSSLGLFRENMVSGRGWIAFALVTFSGSNPLLVILAAILFGAGDAIQLRFQALGVPIPFQFLLMIPYVLTLAVLIISSIREKYKKKT